MKFKNVEDKQLFLMEIERTDLIKEVDDDWTPEEEMVELFIKRRSELIGRLKNFRKSQDTKNQWRHNRYKMMKGIKSFHKSTKGKQFHRALGKFLATRFSGSKNLSLKKENFELARLCTEALKGLSSLRTHLYIEMNYFRMIEEELSFVEAFDLMTNTSIMLERKLLGFDLSITDEDWDIMLTSVEPKVFIEVLSEELEMDIEEMNRRFEEKEEIEELTSTELYDFVTLGKGK